jgi:hypothetical protein
VKPCVFCPNPPSRRGEHLWDDWLNKLDGKPLKRDYVITEYGRDGVLLRTYGSRQVHVRSPVVCEQCNNVWMATISANAKATLEGCIRYARPATFLPLGIATIAQLLFLKAIVFDCDRGVGFFPRLLRSRFRTSGGALPKGAQVWLASFRGRAAHSGFAAGQFAPIPTGRFRGFDLYIFTYIVGFVALQLTYPKWTRLSKPKVLPFITQDRVWDDAAIPIWPNVTTAQWPPTKHLSDNSKQAFEDRFGTLQELLP